MKKELSLVEFQRVCGTMNSVRFYYASPDGSGDSPFASISVSFPPPLVSPNAEAVCFGGDGGTKMILRCIRRVSRSREGGVTRFRFDCGYADGAPFRSYTFSVV